MARLKLAPGDLANHSIWHSAGSSGEENEEEESPTFSRTNGEKVGHPRRCLLSQIAKMIAFPRAQKAEQRIQ